MNTLVSVRNFAGLCGLTFALGCVGAPEDTQAANEAQPTEEAPLGTAASAITDGDPATISLQARAAALSNGCTGTIISSTHVLTAASCLNAIGQTVKFYNNSITSNTSSIAVTNVHVRPGVDPSTGDLTDTNGDFADLAILTLASAIPSTSIPSKLGIFYPGSSATGIQVGQGNHDGVTNSTDELRFASNGLYSSTNSSGFFYTNDHRTDGGDSGGPIFVNGELQGDLWGYTLVAGALRDKYTAVSYYLPWILSVIGFTGSFTSITSNVIRTGTIIDSLVSPDLNTCKLFCMQESSCVAFSHRPAPSNVCNIFSTLGGTVAFSGAVTGVR